MTDYHYVGSSTPRVDAQSKVTGEALYAGDVALPGMLVGKCKRSPHPFARILNIDTEKAQRLPGVRAVITARDVKQYPFGEYAADQLPLCKDYAYYAGDEVAAVAAVNAELALEALDLIEVDYEVLQPVFDAREALEQDAPVVHPEMKGDQGNLAYRLAFERGEGEKGFRHADLILEERFSTQPMHQGYLQTRDCLAWWQNGKLTIWAVLQSPFRMRIPIAESIGLREEDIRVIPCAVGGGFGNNALRIWPITSLLTMASGKPVKMVLTREEDFIAGRPLVSEDLAIKMGFKKDGTLVAKKLDIIADTGAYTGSSRGVTSVSASRPDNMYRCPHMATTANLVYTNTVPRGSLRGYGTQILNFALESMMDMAAEELGLGRTQIRHCNAVEKGETTVHGMILNSCAFRETIDLAAGKSNLRQTRTPKNGKAYGIGFGCAMHVAGNRNVVPLFDGSSALVTVDKTGKVRIISGELDIGQGSDTVFTQITAEALGARVEDIKVVPVDTETSPFALGTFGDRVTVLGGAAVRLAATRVKEQLIAFTAEALEANPEDLDLKDSQFFVKGMPKPVATLPEMALKATFKRGGLPVMGQGDYTVPEWVGFTDNKTQYGNYSIAYTFITQVAEVAVDLRTGVADVTNIWCAVDLGKVFNPRASEGQVEGGVMMGIGYALTEDYVLENGVMQNPNFHDYKVPSFSNLPKINSYFIEEPDPNTPFGAKSIGEAIGDPTAAAVANAIYDAVGVRVKNLPITPEKILRALREKETSS